MIGGFITVKDVAEKWNISPRTVQILCAGGKIEGAIKFGREWAIPESAEKPKDKRLTTCKYVNWRKRCVENRKTCNDLATYGKDEHHD